MKKLLNYLKNLNLISILSGILVLGVFLFVLLLYRDAKNIGETIGGGTGKLIGGPIGAVEGYYDGIQEGHDHAIVNPETESKITEQTVKSYGVLQVLTIDFKATDVYKHGNQENPEYARLYSRNGKARFSVDLKECEIEERSDNYFIRLPQIKVSIDEIDAEKQFDEYLVEYEKKDGVGSTSDGAKGWLQADKKNKESLQNEFLKDEAIMNKAKESAKNQIENLFFALTGKTAEITFEEER